MKRIYEIQATKDRIRALSNADLLEQTLLSAMSLYDEPDYEFLDEELKHRLSEWSKSSNEKGEGKMSELKACPFCGGTNFTQSYIREHRAIGQIRLHNVCEDCGASAWNAWNTRPIEDALRSRIDTLEAERRWIPVSDKRIEQVKSILAFEDGKIYIAEYDQECASFFRDDVGEVQPQFTHWMPLPTPPEAE